MLALPL